MKASLIKREKIYVEDVLDILFDNFSFLATFHLSVNMGGSLGGAEDLFDLAADWVRHYYGGKGSPEQCTQPSMTSQPVGHGTALLTPHSPPAIIVCLGYPGSD